METEVRKVYFYSVDIESKKGDYDFTILIKVLKWADTMNKKMRKLNMEDENRIHFLHSIVLQDDLLFLTFESLKYNFRPRLVNIDTATERENPKRLNEGDKILTHVCVKIGYDNLILAVESRVGGINMSCIKRMFRQLCKVQYWRT